MGSNGPSEAASKTSITKDANEERPKSINNPPRQKFPFLGPSVRGKQGEPHRPMIPLTGSADDGKRSALYVVVDRGYQGDSSIQSFGLVTPGRGRRIVLLAF